MNKNNWLRPLLVTLGINLLALFCFVEGIVFIGKATDFMITLFVSIYGAKAFINSRNNGLAMSVALICVTVNIIGLTIHTHNSHHEQSLQIGQTFIDEVPI